MIAVGILYNVKRLKRAINLECCKNRGPIRAGINEAILLVSAINDIHGFPNNLRNEEAFLTAKI
jgi:hypothetical protein